jgi:transposase
VRTLSSVLVSNVLREEQKQQIIALGRLGWSLRRIQRETGVRRETISAYLKEAGVALRPPRGRRIRAKPASPTGAVTPDSKPAKPASEAEEVTTDSGGESADRSTEKAEWKAGRSPSASACEPYVEAIEAGLAKGRNAKAIWQDLVDVYGFAGEYQSVKRFIRKCRGQQSPEACAVIETAPGEELQVDYGTGPMVLDGHAGKYQRTRLFVLTLGYSRKCIRLLVFGSSSQTWAELHEKAFRRLGGVTRVVVLDNLREGVLKPDIYDPTVNPLYRDLLRHYNVVALSCRVRDPDRKGKVERGVGHAKNTPLKGLRFESLEAAQTYLDHWETNWADTRIHGTTKRQVAAMFAEEKPSLQLLPVEPFRYYQYGKRTVNLDGCVEVDAAYYGAPPGWIGRHVQVQWDSHQVRLMDPQTGQLLREHLRPARGRHRIKDEDRPKQTPLTPLQLLSRADRAGAQIGALCRGMHQKDGETAVRRILGVLSLVKKYGGATVDDACATALKVAVRADYHFVRRYLERHPQLSLSLRPVDPLIRQLTLYRDFIEGKTKESNE